MLGYLNPSTAGLVFVGSPEFEGGGPKSEPYLETNPMRPPEELPLAYNRAMQYEGRDLRGTP